MERLKAPFPYFGGKSAIAGMVWQRLGDVPNYVEPCVGSNIMVLSRPHEPRVETINDADALLANFWRALQHDPDAVAFYADWPVNEVDLHARHQWLIDRKLDVADMLNDPHAYDAKAAGWWVWGISQWIGGEWCVSRDNRRPHTSIAGMGVHRKRPHLMSEKGTHRCMPEVHSARGVHRVHLHRLPHISNAGTGVHRSSVTSSQALKDYMYQLAARLRRVRVVCGDWSRVTGPSVTYKIGLTGVFLDPPYSHIERNSKLYSEDQNIAAQAAAWAIANGNNPLMRIVFCGYDTEHTFPETWTKIHWKANGGYGNQSTKRGRENAKRETVWFSPHCLDLDALPMFEYLQNMEDPTS